MPANLRTVFRPLLQPLGMEETEFWELERAGRMAGLFDVGRTGPGGGTPATPHSVAMTVIALLAGLTKREAARLAGMYAATEFHPEHSSDPIDCRCGLTGASTFGGAVSAILAAPALAARVVDMTAFHRSQGLRIAYTPPARWGAPDGVIVMSGFGGFERDTLRITLTRLERPFFTLLAERLAELDIRPTE